MKIRQLRNATLILELGEHVLLIDPVLSRAGGLVPFRFRPPRRRNPLVSLPKGTSGWLRQVTAVLLTHGHHVDHFDRPGEAWVRKSQLTLWATALDLPTLQGRGLRVQQIRDGFLGMGAEVVPAVHGTGLMGWMMGPGSGLFLAHPDEPSVYLTGDAVLTDDLLAAVDRLQPDVIVAPAGTANFGIGPDILFTVDELMRLTRRTQSTMVFNHLEALDHCPTTRDALRKRLAAEGLSHRCHVPEDGEQLAFSRDASRAPTPRRADTRVPGIQTQLVNWAARWI